MSEPATLKSFRRPWSWTSPISIRRTWSFRIIASNSLASRRGLLVTLLICRERAWARSRTLSTESASLSNSLIRIADMEPFPNISSSDCTIVSPCFSRRLILLVHVSMSASPLGELVSILIRRCNDSSARLASSSIRVKASLSPSWKKPLTRRITWFKQPSSSGKERSSL